MPAGAATYDVFLSYSRADATAADRLRTRLADAGLKTFLDRYSLPGGRPWQPELETALGHCRALVVLLGPAGIGGWQHREIQLGLVRQGAAEQTPTPFPVIPVLLPGLQPDDVPLGTFLNLNTWVDLRPGLDGPEALQRLIAAVQGRAIDSLTRDLAGLRPYRGLLPFREQDAGLFFGRQRFIDELTVKVRQRSTTNVVAVLGRSGSGKSSIVFAGLFPALRQEKGAGQQAVWQILDLRPGAEPLHALVEAFDPPEPNLSRTQKLALVNAGADLLRQRKVSLAQLVRDRLKDDPGTTRLLLYVDQWEELYTQAQKREVRTDEDKAHAADARLFVDLVLEAAATAPCTLVISARSDFYADIQTHDALRAAVQDCQVSLGPMTAAELTAAIEGPARAVGGSVAPELTKKLLRDIGLDLSGGRDDHYDIGKLPLLEYALEQAWTKAASSEIGLGQYAGLEQALEERANQVFGRLPPEQKAAAKRLFVSLVTPGEGREDTRARFALPADPAMLAAAETFAGASARLIVTGDDASGSRLAEVSHEALIRHWDKLRAWVDENRINLRTRTALAGNREEWLRRGKDRSLLIEAGLRLEAARRLRDQPGDVVIADIADYLDASFIADGRRRRRLNAAVTATVATAVAMAGLAGWGWYQFTQAQHRADETAAALIWARLDFEGSDNPRSNSSVLALWNLATAPTAMRNAFLRQLADDQYQITKFGDGLQSIVRSFGLRPAASDSGPLLRGILRVTDDNAGDSYAIAQVMPALRLRLPYSLAQIGLDAAIDATADTKNFHHIIGLAAVAAALDPSAEQASLVLDRLVETRPWWIIGGMKIGDKEVITSLISHISSNDAEEIFSPIIFVDNNGYVSFEAVICALIVSSLHNDTLKSRSAKLILKYVENSFNSNDLLEINDGIQVLKESQSIFTGVQAQSIFMETLRVMIVSANDGQAPLLSQVFHVFASKLEQAQAEDALRQVNSSVATASKSGLLIALANAGRSLGPRVPSDKKKGTVALVLHAISIAPDADAAAALAESIYVFDPEPEQKLEALSLILDRIARTESVFDISRLCQSISTLDPTSAQAEAALKPLFSNITKTTDGDALRVLSDALKALAHRMSPEQKRQTLAILLDTMRYSTDPFQLQPFAKAIRAVGPNPEQAKIALTPVLSTIVKSPGDFSLQVLAEAIQSLGPMLDAEQTNFPIELARIVLAKTDTPSVAEAFARAIAVTLPADSQQPELYVAAVVELLKWPTTAGPATDALLEVLHERVPEAPGKEAGLDATVAWVAKKYPNIDLDSPPIFPASGSTGGAW